MRRRPTIAALLGLVLLGFGPAAAKAETVMLLAVGCEVGGHSFDDELHRLWYDRFWTGSCSGLWFEGCFPGEAWPDLVEDLGQKHGRQQVQGLVPRFCALGRSIGHEWARDNDLRLISTDELERWYANLRQAQDLEATLQHYEDLVSERLGQ